MGNCPAGNRKKFAVSTDCLLRVEKAFEACWDILLSLFIARGLRSGVEYFRVGPFGVE